MPFIAPPSNLGAFLKRELDRILPGYFMERYPTLWGTTSDIIPSTPDLEIGIENIVEQMMRTVGEAKFLANGTQDIPAADIGISEANFKVFAWASRCQYSILELGAASAANKPIKELRAKAAVKALLEKMHRYALVGRPDASAFGLMNQPAVSLSISAYNALTATAQQHVDFVAESLQIVSDNSEMTEEIDTLLVPSKLYSIWTRTILPNTSKNILSYIQENLNNESVFRLSRIVAINESRATNLERLGVNATGTSRDRLIFLSSKPEIMERKYYAPIELDPQLVGLEWLCFMFMGCSELILHYPGAMRYVEINTLG